MANYQKPNIKESLAIVNKKLAQLKLNPLKDPIINLKDKTRLTYSDLVEDQKKRRYFIKIKIITNEFVNRAFAKNIVIMNLLKHHSELSLSYRTPQLIDYDDQYLLFENIEAVNMGSRIQHDLSRLGKSDLGEIIALYQSIIEVPVSFLPKNFEKRDWEHFMFFIFKNSEFNSKKLAYFYSQTELNKIDSLKNRKDLKKLINQQSHYFSHGDLQPPNILKDSAGKLFLVDWDQSSISSKFYDAIQFYNHSYRTPLLQKLFLKEIFGQSSAGQETEINFLLFVWLFLWSKIVINKLDSPSFRARKDFAIINRILYRRVKEAKLYLSKII